MEIEYLELRDAETLGEYTPDRGAVLAAAVHLGAHPPDRQRRSSPPRVPGLRGQNLIPGKVPP